jgi:mannose-6-phosphate isomerase-like protein (cupin superfamily)
MSITMYRWGELPRQTLFEGTLSRTALRTDAAIVTFNWFQPDAPRSLPHTHPFDQLVMVVEGRLNLEIDGEILVMQPGSAIRVPPGAPHTAWPAGDDPVLNIDVFGTVREDYLFLTRHQREIFDGAPTTGATGSQGFSIWTASDAPAKR